jgi:hypothetical protein
MSQDLKEIYWKDVPFNKTLQKPQPAMIHDESGFLTEKQFKRKNLGSCYIKYDRHYVIFWLVRNFFQALMITEYNDAQALLSQAWKEYKQPKEKLSKG